MINLALGLSLDIQPRLPESLALVGAGGKTTAMFQLAWQLARPGLPTDSGAQPQVPVLVTTTTHLATVQLALAGRVFPMHSSSDIHLLESQLVPGVNLVVGTEAPTGRVSGPGPVALERLKLLSEERGLDLLIEADGSRQRPLKAPGDHEPATPAFVHTVMVVAGLTGLNQPLTPDWVHRPGRFAEISGLEAGQPVTADGLARVLLDARGGLKGIPAEARRVCLLNQVDTPELRSQAWLLAKRLLTGYPTVLSSSLASSTIWSVHRPVAGIVLAAGGSKRLGSPKQLLTWKGKPFVWHVVQAALKGGLSPVWVVTGSHAAEVEAVLQGLPVRTVYNPDWEQGQSTSLKTGVRALTPDVAAAIFLLADQPQVPAVLVGALVEAHATTLSPLVAPRTGGRRANPVLFGAETFPELMKLSGDTGGRVLFSEPDRYPVTWVDWEDEAILLDVDTMDDFEKLSRLA